MVDHIHIPGYNLKKPVELCNLLGWNRRKIHRLRDILGARTILRRSEALGEQSINNVTWTSVIFDTVAGGDETLFDAGSPTKMLIRENGQYVACFTADVGTPDPGQQLITRILKNGLTVVAESRPALSSQLSGCSCDHLLILSKGEYLEFQAKSGDTILAENLSTPIASIVRLDG